MIHLIPIQIALFLGFIVPVALIYGIQPSISDYWYARGKKSPLFTVWMVLIGMSIIVVYPLTGTVFYFWSGACLCFVGVAAEFRKKMTRTIHVIGAIGGIGLAYDGLWIYGAAYLAVCGVLRLMKVSNLTLWIECMAFIGVIKGFLTYA